VDTLNVESLETPGLFAVEPPSPQLPEIDASALAGELASAIEGEVRFDAGSRALYATDASNYRRVPIGVVLPRRLDDVIRTVSADLLWRRHLIDMRPLAWLTLEGRQNDTPSSMMPRVSPARSISCST